MIQLTRMDKDGLRLYMGWQCRPRFRLRRYHGGRLQALHIGFIAFYNA